MPKWEYLVIHLRDDKTHQDNPEIDVYMDVDKYTESLNRYGNAGWELVSFQMEADGAKAALKRLKEES
jgi:pentose-5-phosphate-3-epimerase